MEDCVDAMMQRRRALLAFAAACALPSVVRHRAFAAQSLRIGVSLGLSGQYKGPAAMHKRAYELWHDEVNGRGGIAGRPIALTIIDDQSDRSRAESIYRQFFSQGSVDFVFGPYSSDLTSAVAPLAEAEGQPMLAPGAAADDIWQKGYRNLFAMLTPASRYTHGMLRLAHGAGLTTVAVLAANDAFASNIAQGTLKWAPYLKLKVVSHARFTKGERDLAVPLREGRAAGAELLIVAGFKDDAINARRGAIDLGWSPPAFFATVGPALPEWITDMGDAGEHVFSTSIWEPADSLAFPGARDFARRFKERFEVTPSYHAATAYAAGQILEAAISTAGSFDRDQVRTALTELDTYSVLGRFAVDQTGMQIKRFEMIVQWQHGRKEIVWPEDLRTALPVMGGATP